MDKVVILLGIPIRFLIGEKDPLWAPYWSLLFPDLFYSSSNSKTWKWFCIWFDFRGFWLADIHRSGTSACPWDHSYHWPLYDKLPFASRAQNWPWFSDKLAIFGRKLGFFYQNQQFSKIHLLNRIFEQYLRFSRYLLCVFLRRRRFGWFPVLSIKERFWLKEITQKQLVLMGISDAKSMIRTVNKRITFTFMLIHGRSRDESSNPNPTYSTQRSICQTWVQTVIWTV